MTDNVGRTAGAAFGVSKLIASKAAFARTWNIDPASLGNIKHPATETEELEAARLQFEIGCTMALPSRAEEIRISMGEVFIGTATDLHMANATTSRGSTPYISIFPRLGIFLRIACALYEELQEIWRLQINHTPPTDSECHSRMLPWIRLADGAMRMNWLSDEELDEQVNLAERAYGRLDDRTQARVDGNLARATAFVVGHELSHVLLGHVTPVAPPLASELLQLLPSPRLHRELQCDLLAAQLLFVHAPTSRPMLWRQLHECTRSLEGIAVAHIACLLSRGKTMTTPLLASSSHPPTAERMSAAVESLSAAFKQLSNNDLKVESAAGESWEDLQAHQSFSQLSTQCAIAFLARAIEQDYFTRGEVFHNGG